MKKFLIAFISLIAFVCFAQDNIYREIDHSSLFSQSTTKLVTGAAVSKSNDFSLLYDKSSGVSIMPTRGFVWVHGDTATVEDDTLRVYVIGYYYSGNAETVSYLDTLDLPIDTSKASAGEFSFTLPQGTGFIDRIKLGYIPESASADDSIQFYSKVVFEYGVNNKITIDTPDSSDVDGWGFLTDADTVSLLATISDTTVLRAQFANYLPLTGGTLTGAVTGTAITLSATLTLQLHTIAEGDSVFGKMFLNAADSCLIMWNGTEWDTIAIIK